MPIAISIPIFTNQLEKARKATDAANLRAAYATAATNKISNNNDNGDASTSGTTVTITQTTAGWVAIDDIAGIDPNSDPVLKTVTKGDKITVSVNDAGTPVFAKA